MHEAFCLKDLFYTSLKAFSEFNEITSDNHFVPLPSTWHIVMTDVKGSTQAISEGRYKDVNTLGAASIVVAIKVLRMRDFPFVFGGDGATMLIPDESLIEVMNQLMALKQLARDNFQMDLRVGSVKMIELINLGKSIEVAKFEMTQDCHMAILRGEGVTYAEKLIKNFPDRYGMNLMGQKEADLSGLTCRWKPIPSRHGKILTILIKAKSDNQIYKKILNQFKNIFPEGLEELNPARTPGGKYKSILESIKNEIKYQRTPWSWSFFKRLFELIPAYFIFNLRLPIPATRNYVKATSAHSDFRKFDDMLRMVIDCSEEQFNQVKVFLEGLHKDQEIFFGLHESTHSLMTCFVEGLNQGEHIHFLDAQGGGYTSAAIQLKDQIQRAISPNSRE
jgi:hypothetical protein